MIHTHAVGGSIPPITTKFDDVLQIGSADRGSNPLASTNKHILERVCLLMGVFWNRRATESNTENQSMNADCINGGSIK